jgi:hypothetical protein
MIHAEREAIAFMKKQVGHARILSMDERRQ